MRKTTMPRLAFVALLIGAVFLLSGCSYFDSPQNTFAPAGDVAQEQKDIFFLTMWPALAILILVEGLIVFILFKFRHKKGDSTLPAQVHGNNTFEIGWTIAPAILLAFFVVPTVGGIVDLGRTPKGAMVVDVTGQRFSWGFGYPDPSGGPTVEGATGVMHIPVNQNIDLRLKSIDVNHSFWVPKLAGKTDAIPGRDNHMWIKATELGEFSGQCAEFCGLAHARMRFSVVVQSREDFDAWLAGCKTDPDKC